MAITTKQFQLLTDINLVWDFLVDIYDRENGEYACFAGMWWIPQNKLAYMEPLCTSPEHRRKGLAAAALTRHYRRMKALGATHMSGGGDPFYEKIGYGKGFHFSFWKPTT